jgi:hypothetical protein
MQDLVGFCPNKTEDNPVRCIQQVTEHALHSNKKKIKVVRSGAMAQ